MVNCDVTVINRKKTAFVGNRCPSRSASPFHLYNKKFYSVILFYDFTLNISPFFRRGFCSSDYGLKVSD